MNAGRLHVLLDQIRRDYEANDTLTKLQSAIDSLTASINAASEENAIAFREALDQLYSALDGSPFNEGTPSQMEMLKEIGASDKVGRELRSEIQATLDSNAVTPAQGLAELQRIGEVLVHFAQIVEQIVTGFKQLKIPYDDLNPGESEVGVVTPWPVIDTNLEGLQKNLHRYDRALKTFGELVENNAKSPIIRSVGSSALQVFIQSTPGIALCIATAIERLCALYKQILEIKVLRKKVQEQSLPEAVTAGMEAHEKQIAENGIEKIAEALIKEFGKGKDKERLHELHNGLRNALRFLADQIDAGVDLEVRAEAPRAKDVAEEGETAKSEKTKRALDAAKKTTARIQRAGAAMRSLERSGERILALDVGEKTKKSA